MLESIISGTVTMPALLVLTCTSTVQCLPFPAFCSATTRLLLLGHDVACAVLHKAAVKINSASRMSSDLFWALLGQDGKGGGGLWVFFRKRGRRRNKAVGDTSCRETL